MNRKQLLVGAGVGAALAYMLDPSQGARRRAIARDKLMSATRRTREGLDATARDVANRTRGVAHAARTRLATENMEDARLMERLRARLRRVCSHPRAIDVVAIDGDVTLRGPILAIEVDDVIATAAAVRGVRSVNNALEPHESAGNIPSLQGKGRAAGHRFDILPGHWAPTTQALVLAGLAATGTYAARHARHH